MPERPSLQDLPLFSAPAVGAGDNAARLAATPAAAKPGLTATHPAHVPAGAPGTVVERTQPSPTAPGRTDRYDPAAIDWALVRTFRQAASQTLAEQLKDRPGIGEDDRRELGRSVVRRLLSDHVQTGAHSGGEPLSAEAETALAQAILDSLFGLGRLQPLIDDDTVEDIELNGADHVVLMHADGRMTRGAPVADNNEELVEFLAFLASRRTDSGERPFSWANPELRLALPGRARLHAMDWVTSRPVVRIRMHRHVDITLDELIRMGMVDQTLASFLTAAVRARRSIVVAGSMGAGKTTFLRALARAVPQWESIGTLETEYELYLDQVGDRLRKPVAIEARPGSGEIGPNGRAAGELTLEDLFPGVLRMNLDRVVVGEVRGGEVSAMFKAMQAGAGSLSTIHAKNARDTINRLATLVHGTGMPMTYAHSQVAQHIDLIVHLSSRRDPETGRRYRYVAEVIEVTGGDGADTHIAVTDVFNRGPDGRAVPASPPTFIDELGEYGFDRAQLDHGQGTWQVDMGDLR